MLFTGDALVRRAESIVAIGASCTHYGAALHDGMLDGDTIRCPLHHACFNLDTGKAIHAPAFDALPRWTVEIREETFFYVAARTIGNHGAPRRNSHVAHGDCRRWRRW